MTRFCADGKKIRDSRLNNELYKGENHMIQKPPGVEDIFPDRIDRWNLIIDSAKKTFGLYNYREIVIPIMEYTEVFARGLGDDTDIVSKEMFTFEDRGKKSHPETRRDRLCGTRLRRKWRIQQARPQ